MGSLQIKKALKAVSSKERAQNNARFFKTEKGAYGEGDRFIGVTVPKQRQIANLHLDTSNTEIKNLLLSPIHEHRFTALLILCERYKKAEYKEKNRIARFYLANLKQVNNWDLVDLSAPCILGDYCLRSNTQKVLLDLAESNNLWARRISIVATYAYIRAGTFALTEKIARVHVTDTEDLMHKATGWMLREMGKRDREKLLLFLRKHSTIMPRTMLRYAIEHFSERERKYWLKKEKKRGNKAQNQNT